MLFSMPPNTENWETNTFHKLQATSVSMYLQVVKKPLSSHF